MTVVEPTSHAVGVQERRYQKLIENIHDTVTVVDQTGAPIWTSASARGDLGYGTDFWKTANLFELVHPEDRENIERNFARLLGSPTSITDGEVRLRQPDGSFRHIAFRAVNRLDDPDIAGLVVTARPIDDEVRQRLERRSRQEELEQALAQRAQFIADLSHEMRSPLHAIVGLTELALSSSDLSPTLDRQIRSINEESQALRVMLDGLLDFSKISANRLDILSEPFSPGAAIDAVARSQGPSARAKQLSFTASIDASVPLVVLGDEHRLRQVLVNLVSNAVKYTRTGSVSLTAKLKENDHIEFSVVDTGPGIPEEAWATLFEPYRQAHEHHTTKGTGLGLVITKRLVELMGGTLRFNTSSDGTTFAASIPLPIGRRANDAVAIDPTRERSMSSLHVLVVDDSAVNLMLAQSQLEHLGHRSTTVDNGPEAIDMLAKKRFDLVLMDWHMPHMDGLETTRLIRSAEVDGNRIPIVATTASVMAGDRETCLDAGMDDYLPKPVSLADLAGMIGRWSGTDTDTDPVGGDGTSEIRALIDELGNPAIAQSIIEAFVAEVPGWRSDLQEGTASGEPVLARRAAHTLKSTAQLLGAHELARLGADFEATQSDAELASKLPALLTELSEATDRLRSISEQLNPPEGKAS